MCLSLAESQTALLKNVSLRKRKRGKLILSVTVGQTWGSALEHYYIGDLRRGRVRKGLSPVFVASVSSFSSGAISTFKISSLASAYLETCMSLDPLLFITGNLPVPKGEHKGKVKKTVVLLF